MFPNGTASDAPLFGAVDVGPRNAGLPAQGASAASCPPPRARVQSAKPSSLKAMKREDAESALHFAGFAIFECPIKPGTTDTITLLKCVAVRQCFASVSWSAPHGPPVAGVYVATQWAPGERAAMRGAFGLLDLKLLRKPRGSKHGQTMPPPPPSSLLMHPRFQGPVRSVEDRGGGNFVR